MVDAILRESKLFFEEQKEVGYHWAGIEKLTADDCKLWKP